MFVCRHSLSIYGTNRVVICILIHTKRTLIEGRKSPRFLTYLRSKCLAKRQKKIDVLFLSSLVVQNPSVSLGINI